MNCNMVFAAGYGEQIEGKGISSFTMSQDGK